MKTIALLCMGAALAVASDQDQSKKPADGKATDGKGANPKAAGSSPASARAARAAEPAPPPARRNVHQNAVPPRQVELTPAQKAAAALPTVPPGAEEVGTNLYRLTDAQGKVWMYRKTPFGVSKWEEKAGGQSAVPEAATPGAGVTTSDLGDSVQFQRVTPFGPQKWVRKKSEMTEDEKTTFATQQHARDAATKSTEKQPGKQ